MIIVLFRTQNYPRPRLKSNITWAEDLGAHAGTGCIDVRMFLPSLVYSDGPNLCYFRDISPHGRTHLGEILITHPFIRPMGAYNLMSGKGEKHVSRPSQPKLHVLTPPKKVGWWVHASSRPISRFPIHRTALCPVHPGNCQVPKAHCSHLC